MFFSKISHTLLLWFRCCCRALFTELQCYFYIPVSKPTHSVLDFHFIPQLWVLFSSLHSYNNPLQPKVNLSISFQLPLTHNMWFNFHSRLRSLPPGVSAHASRHGEDVTHQAGHRLVSPKCSFSASCVVIAPQITMTAGGCGETAGLTATHQLGVRCHGHRCTSTCWEWD